jgi:hypothetical protein
MKIGDTDNWVQGIGLLGVIGSLVFVGLQLRQSEDIAFSDVSESSVTWGIELSSLIADHVDVWHKACLGEELSPQERIIAGNIYWRYAQGNLNSWVRMETTGIGVYESSFLTDAFAANIHRYPGFRKMVGSLDEWYQVGAPMESPLVEKFRLDILARVSELEVLEPNPNSDVMWCGIR